jgi:hypothetical protein
LVKQCGKLRAVKTDRAAAQSFDIDMVTPDRGPLHTQ